MQNFHENFRVFARAVGKNKNYSIDWLGSGADPANLETFPIILSKTQLQNPNLKKFRKGDECFSLLCSETRK